MMRRAAFAAVLLALAGCSNGNASRLPRKAWVDRANAICARADRQIHAYPGARTLPQLARLLDRTVPISQRQLVELVHIRPEPAEEPRVHRILAAMRRAQVELSSVRAAAEARSWPRVNAQVERLAAAERRSDRLVTAYGLHECRSDDG